MAFVCVYVEHITVGDLQMLVSYVSLYSNIIHSLKPFTSDLFRAFGGLANARRGGSCRGLKMLDATAILVWRVSLALLEFDGG